MGLVPVAIVLGLPVAILALVSGMKAKRLFAAGDEPGARAALRRSRAWWLGGAVAIGVLGGLALEL